MNTLIINPGSKPLTEGSLGQAWVNARRWLHEMENHGIHDVEIEDIPSSAVDGRWTFVFKHKVTGKEATLKTHGLTHDECKEYIFYPRSYWNGSSSSIPELEDFLCEGFKIAIVEDKP